MMDVTVESDYTFAQIPEWVIDAGLSARGVQVLAILGLYTFERRRGGICSHQTIAKRARTSVSTVRRAIDELVGLGVVTSQERFAGNRQTSNHYVIHHLGVFTSEQGGVSTDSQGEVSTSEQQNQSKKEPEQEETKLATRNVAWEFFVDPTGFNLPVETAKQRNRVGSLAREVNATLVSNNVNPDDGIDVLNQAALSWPAHFESATLTPDAFEKHLPALLRTPLRGEPIPARQVKRAAARARTRAAVAKLGEDE